MSDCQLAVLRKIYRLTPPSKTAVQQSCERYREPAVCEDKPSSDGFITRVGYSRGTWEPGSQEILGPQAKYLAGVTPLSCNIQMISCWRKLYLVNGAISIWKVIISCQIIFPSPSSCQNKWFIVKGNDFMSKETFSVKRNKFLSKEMISCQMKLIPAKGNDFLSKEINNCQRKWFPVEIEGQM